jgi:hypothetical protein
MEAFSFARQRIGVWLWTVVVSLTIISLILGVWHFVFFGPLITQARAIAVQSEEVQRLTEHNLDESERMQQLVESNKDRVCELLSEARYRQ